MCKKNIYMVQASTTFGSDNFKSAYLPYATGLLVAYAFSDEKIRQSYSFKRFIFIKEELESAVSSLEEPRFVGFSSYIWNTEYNKALAQKIKERFPACKILFGGHNISPDTAFLKDYDYIDFLIHGEGEEAFRKLLLELDRDEPDFSAVPNLSYRAKNGELRQTPLEETTKIDYPSPYLEGYFDDIINENTDMQLDAIIETSRGCPRSCAYCDWGCGASKVKLYPLERIFAEIDWLAEHKTAFIWGADANFGAYERDELIVDHLVEVRQRTGYPERLRINYAKNNKETVMNISRKLEKYGLSKEGATLSFQSLNPEVLKIIGRSNMSMESFENLVTMYKRENIKTYSELILGLPGETYESFCEGVGKLLAAGQHRLITIYNCIVLPNSALATEEFRRKYQIKTVDVVPLMAHNTSVTSITEVTRYIVGTSTMSSEEWIEANIFACFACGLHHYGVLKCIAAYMWFEQHMPYEVFYNGVIDFAKKHPSSIGHGIYEFLHSFHKTLAQGTPAELYKNSRYGGINWTCRYVPHLETIYRTDDFYNELREFFLSLGIAQDVLDELLEYQKCTLKLPGKNNFSRTFSHNWHEYFTGIFTDNRAVLREEETEVTVANQTNPSDWNEYALEAAWFGKNGGPLNPGISSRAVERT